MKKVEKPCGIYKIWFEGAPLNPEGIPKIYVGLGKNIRARKMGKKNGKENYPSYN